MTFLRIMLAAAILLASACSPDSVRCPTIHPEKLKKASVNRMKLYQLHRQEQLLARSKEKEYYELVRSQQRQVKKSDPEEWDCPRPGSSHSRMIEKHRKRLEVQNARNLKRKPNVTTYGMLGDMDN